MLWHHFRLTFAIAVWIVPKNSHAPHDIGESLQTLNWSNLICVKVAAALYVSNMLYISILVTSLFRPERLHGSRWYKLLVARRATYVVDGRFFAHIFWKVEGTVRIHVNSHVAYLWLLCRMVGGGAFQTSENSESLENFKFLVARRATYVVDGRFFAHFFWKVGGDSMHTC